MRHFVDSKVEATGSVKQPENPSITKDSCSFRGRESAQPHEELTDWRFSLLQFLDIQFRVTCRNCYAKPDKRK